MVGTGDMLPVQHWKVGFWSGGCGLQPWSFGSSSSLLQQLVVTEQQAKFYF